MQSCLDCSKLAQTCGKLVTSMPRTSILVWVKAVNILGGNAVFAGFTKNVTSFNQRQKHFHNTLLKNNPTL